MNEYAVIAAPSSFVLEDSCRVMNPAPFLDKKIRLIRAGLGLVCLFSAPMAALSFLAAITLKSTVAGILFGASFVLFWLAVKIGRWLSPPPAPKGWKAVASESLD